MTHWNIIAASSLGAMAALGWGVSGDAAEAPQIVMPSAATDQLAAIPPAAIKTYKDRCLQCHGATGKGDGKESADLDPKPRSFSDKEWQKSVTDDHLRKVTVEGGPAVDMSAGMPAHEDLGKPKKEAILDGLVALIRAFGK